MQMPKCTQDILIAVDTEALVLLSLVSLDTENRSTGSGNQTQVCRSQGGRLTASEALQRNKDLGRTVFAETHYTATSTTRLTSVHPPPPPSPPSLLSFSSQPCHPLLASSPWGPRCLPPAHQQRIMQACPPTLLLPQNQIANNFIFNFTLPAMLTEPKAPLSNCGRGS